MAIYHLHVATGTRAGGQSAAAKFDYLARRGEYSRQPDKIAHLISGNMPDWAASKARLYWESADLYERANGRLFKQLEGALPLELNHEQRVALAEKFARQVADVPGGGLPFTLALHVGKSKKEDSPGNPHFHLEISERINDGHPRNSESWFRRAAVGKRKTVAEGGAPKTEVLKPTIWLQNTRELWANLCNQALALAGHQARVDHRSLQAQEIQRDAQFHLGPQALGFEARAGRASRRRIELEQLQAVERTAAAAKRSEIARLQADAESERFQAMRLLQAAAAFEAVPQQRTDPPVWAETSEGLDLAGALATPDQLPPGAAYRIKKLRSGVILHLRMPADRVAFVERSDRIRMSDALDPEAVARALKVACAKWGSVNVTGNAEFRKLVVEQATSLDLLDRIGGLTPDDLQFARELASISRGLRSP